MIYPEPEKGGRGQNSSVAKDFSGARLSLARAVLKWAPELADAVLAGAESLDRAYQVAGAPTMRHDSRLVHSAMRSAGGSSSRRSHAQAPMPSRQGAQYADRVDLRSEIFK